MSAAPLPGAPIGPDAPLSATANAFTHVPRLHELLPNGGWPGVVYAQVCVHNAAAARDRADEPANLRPIRGTSYYAISGPKGLVHMALVGTGSPIPGAAPESGARLFFTDGEVTKLTGHPVQYPIWFTQEAHTDAEVHGTPTPNRPGQDPESDARVQARDAAQQLRKQGHKPQAGSSHSNV